MNLSGNDERESIREGNVVADHCNKCRGKSVITRTFHRKGRLSNWNYTCLICGYRGMRGRAWVKKQ